MKRTELAEFSNPRSGGVIAAGLKEGDRILDATLSDGTAEIMLLTRNGRAIRFAEGDVSVMGRTAQGVKGIDLRDDDRVVGMLLIRREAAVLTVTEDGMGKRTDVGEFPLQNRGGLGTLAVPSSGRTGPVVGAMEVVTGDTVMVVTAGGQVTRLSAAEIPLQGRRTQGRRLVEVPAGDRVVEVTRAAGPRSQDEGPAETPGSGGGEGSGGDETGSGDEEDQLELMSE